MCIFCQNDIRSKTILENNEWFCIFDSFPVSLGHALIIPKRHTDSFFLLQEHETKSLYSFINKVKELIDNTYHPSGYNLGINNGIDAGQTVMHLHIHLIPRYPNDMNDPRGGVRGVIPSKQKYGDKK